jgi:hypothetical protein
VIIEPGGQRRSDGHGKKCGEADCSESHDLDMCCAMRRRQGRRRSRNEKRREVARAPYIRH